MLDRGLASAIILRRSCCDHTMKAFSGLFTYGEDIPWDHKSRLAEMASTALYDMSPEKMKHHLQKDWYFCAESTQKQGNSECIIKDI